LLGKVIKYNPNPKHAQNNKTMQQRIMAWSTAIKSLSEKYIIKEKKPIAAITIKIMPRVIVIWLFPHLI
jgi:hypothetical protein